MVLELGLGRVAPWASASAGEPRELRADGDEDTSRGWGVAPDVDVGRGMVPVPCS